MKDKNSIKFIVDAMLVKLGKFMRILGLDTDIVNNLISDEGIIQHALETDRILITMDKSLYEQLQKQTKKVIFLNTAILEEQLVSVIINSSARFSPRDINDPLSYNSRCSRCNSLIESVSKDRVKNQIPKQSFDSFDHFWICSNKNCEKIYWRGSHWNRICRTIDIVRNDLNKLIG
ncbi:MAG: Mut7-C RNAse domain-containing protein [Candidatus Hodarchaeota archaeon]